MAGLWRLCCYWRKNGYRYIPDPYVVHIHIVPYHGITHCCVYGNGVLDEHKALYPECEEESAEVFVGKLKITSQNLWPSTSTLTAIVNG